MSDDTFMEGRAERQEPFATANRVRKALPQGRADTPVPSTLLQGREYIPANQHTGASGLRSFLDRQIARGLKPREHKDYFSGPNF
jgi:hypothetical protein